MVNSDFISILIWKLFHVQLKSLGPTDECKTSNSCKFISLVLNQSNPTHGMEMHIYKQTHQFCKGITWKVGDTIDINFWLENWCCGKSLAEMFDV